MAVIVSISSSDVYGMFRDDKLCARGFAGELSTLFFSKYFFLFLQLSICAFFRLV